MIVDHLLEISRLDERKGLRERVRLDLGDMARATTEQMRLLAEVKSVEVRYVVSEGVEVEGDPLYLKQAIVNLVDNQVDFLSNKALAMPSVIVATFWRGFPFWVISFLAALQNVSPEQYEAAAIDGANAWGRFRHITLPGIRHVVLVVLLLSTIWTTNGFDNIFILTQGGPSDATMTFPMLAYFGLQSLKIGEASAVSVAMLPASNCLWIQFDQ